MDTDVEFESIFLAGEYRTFIAPEIANNKLTRQQIDEPLFNSKNITRRIINTGSPGLYFLEIRPGSRLKDLIVQPEDVIEDIYAGIDDTLIYCFYNISDSTNLVVTAIIETDDENIAQKLKSDPEDIIWRNYFIRRAMNLDKVVKTPVTKAKKQEHEILTADEAAEYLRIDVKTLQNYVSSKKITSLRGGKFRKAHLDLFLEKKGSRKK